MKNGNLGPVMTGATGFRMAVYVAVGSRGVCVPRGKLRSDLEVVDGKYEVRARVEPATELALVKAVSGDCVEMTPELRGVLDEIGFESCRTLKSDVVALKRRCAQNTAAVGAMRADLENLRAQIARIREFDRVLKAGELEMARDIEASAAKTKEELAALRAEILVLRGQAAGGRQMSGSRSMPDIAENDVPQGSEFPYKGNAFDGIIAHLTEEFGGNVVEQEVVQITARDGSGMKYIVEFSDYESNYCSKNVPEPWFCIDFEKRSVYVTNYTFRTYAFGGKNYFHPKSWVVEASMDGKQWMTIDTRVDNQDLNGASKTKTFSIPRDRVHRARYVRVRSTGPNHNGKNHLVCAGFEVFGTLCEP